MSTRLRLFAILGGALIVAVLVAIMFVSVTGVGDRGVATVPTTDQLPADYAAGAVEFRGTLRVVDEECFFVETDAGDRLYAIFPSGTRKDGARVLLDGAGYGEGEPIAGEVLATTRERVMEDSGEYSRYLGDITDRCMGDAIAVGVLAALN
jgi:hypothetical protein